jgi:ribonuclease HI
MHFDGSLNLEGAGVGILFISPQGDHLKYILQIHYKVSNNSAEYEALIHGLCIAVSLGTKRLITYGNSKLVIHQVNKARDIKKDSMNAYYTEVRKLEAHFDGLEFVTPSFKGKTECIDHVCARIKLHTRLDIMNTKNSAT